mmetsp:Transcript_6648/g.21522  ORF Transcript_6648/g.21522 Transcript_6648/m.21522 type:complete len:212 (+) Transcript_6648:247-882(+)
MDVDVAPDVRHLERNVQPRVRTARQRRLVRCFQRSSQGGRLHETAVDEQDEVASLGCVVGVSADNTSAKADGTSKAGPRRRCPVRFARHGLQQVGRNVLGEEGANTVDEGHALLGREDCLHRAPLRRARRGLLQHETSLLAVVECVAADDTVDAVELLAGRRERLAARRHGRKHVLDDDGGASLASSRLRNGQHFTVFVAGGKGGWRVGSL